MRMRGRWIGSRAMVVGLVAVLALVVAACTEDGDGSVTLPETDITVPEVTAPEVTAPEATTPETAAPSEPDTGGSEDSSGANTAAIWPFVIGGIIVVGLVAYFASRSGARQGAEDQRNAELAEQYRAEEAARKAQYEAMPPPPIPDEPTSTGDPSGDGSTEAGRADDGE